MAIVNIKLFLAIHKFTSIQIGLRQTSKLSREKMRVKKTRGIIWVASKCTSGECTSDLVTLYHSTDVTMCWFFFSFYVAFWGVFLKGSWTIHMPRLITSFNFAFYTIRFCQGEWLNSSQKPRCILTSTTSIKQTGRVEWAVIFSIYKKRKENRKKNFTPELKGQSSKMSTRKNGSNSSHRYHDDLDEMCVVLSISCQTIPYKALFLLLYI